jgi:hypothetical protein
MMSGCKVELRVSKLPRRELLLHENEILTQTEVRKHLDSPIAEIFFSSLDEMANKLTGITFFLMGPETQL